MNERLAPPQRGGLEGGIAKRLDRFAENTLLSLLGRLKRGGIRLLEGDTERIFGRPSPEVPLVITLSVKDPAFYRRALVGGSIGAAEAYILGHWSTDDLTGLIRIVLCNPELFATIDGGWSRLSDPLYKIFHRLRRDTRKGSRINIAAHYDLGNDFYALFLDDTLTYSCGIFEREESTLEEAATAKYDRICRKLCLEPRDRVLEIGTGWGGFAIHAAKAYGCRVTTTTISRAQYGLARQRILDAGLAHRVDLLLEDYRDLKGKYDKLVSIEMIEAVGHAYLETFFRVCSERLKPDGMMLLQAITIADHVFGRHKGSVDFIKRYIFPGSCIPSVSAMCRAVARKTDLRLDHLEDITTHYPRTLRTWRERFLMNIEKVRALGFPDTFIRMWEYYLCYCEAGFKERYLGDVQMRFFKPLRRPAPLLPGIE
jgi:cyclopropane-fatty-acyl-phospholipid synthase